MSTNAVSLCLAIPTLYGLYHLGRFAYNRFTSPINDIPGPAATSLFVGNLREVFEAQDTAELMETWTREHGHVLKYSGLLGERRIYTTDLRALNHIYMCSDVYYKRAFTRRALENLLGQGLLVVEGEKHKLERKIMNPAFGPAQVRALTVIFFEKALKLRDIWLSKIVDGSANLDILIWLSRMTLDVIGKAGFDYDFANLEVDQPPNELNEVFSILFHVDTNLPIFDLLQTHIPGLHWLPTKRGKQRRHAKAIMDRIGQRLLAESKAAAQESANSQRKDLLALLVKSNLSEKGLRISDEDALAQIATFFAAGHETTSTTTTWALFSLSQNIRVQSKLREELLAVPTENPTMDELNALPYLDQVVREVLRLSPPVAVSARQAVKDDVIPLEKPFVDRKGVNHDCIRVRKGQVVFTPILPINRSKELWGDDASDFRPERWDAVPEAARNISGWGNMFTFLSGPRACIGYRFALVEMKALLFTLIRAFTFQLAVPASEIGRRADIVTRPIVVTEPSKNQMPMIIRPVDRVGL